MKKCIICFVLLLCFDTAAVFAIEQNTVVQASFFPRLRALVIKMQDNVLYSKNVYEREVKCLLYSYRSKPINTGYDLISWSALDLDRQYRGVITYSDWLVVRIVNYKDDSYEKPEPGKLYSIEGTLEGYYVQRDQKYPVMLYLKDAVIKKLEEK